MKIFTTVLIIIFGFTNAQLQDKFSSHFEKSTSSSPQVNHSLKSEALEIFQDAFVPNDQVNNAVLFNPIALSPVILENGLKPIYDQHSGEIIAIKGSIASLKSLSNHAERCEKYLKSIGSVYRLNQKHVSAKSVKSTVDENERIHTQIDQLYKGIKVYGGEMMIHEADGNIYLLQGKTKVISNSVEVIPTINKDEVIGIAKSTFEKYIEFSDKLTSLMQHEQASATLLIHAESGNARLVWQVDIFPNVMGRETLFIDAHSGEVIDRFKTLCTLHTHGESHAHTNLNEKQTSQTSTKELFLDGRVKSTAVDLYGNRSNIDIFECSNEFFLVDASRPMFKGTANSCADPDALLNGVIVTMDAGNRSPSNRDFDYEISSSRQLDSWTNASAISAHLNGGQAYTYFKNVHNRESITGNGTNIVSFVNVADEDGEDMDNAFWNGDFIFYGNGNFEFSSPLAKALDVAGHEMSHGVIQTTANLEYRNESGALNEHFADVFAVLIENEDFLIGEDTANPNVFPSGAIRSLQNPNNGGTRLGDPGYQPAHVSEQYFGDQDEGGVHINSGIPNFAFFKFVTDESFGTDINERAAIGGQIWYRALTKYLRSNSNFSDMRVATVQVAMEDYGATVANALAASFDAVGITAANVTAETEDVDTNPGEEFVIWSDINLGTVKISRSNGDDFGILSSTSHISRPSVTDNGRFTIFVNAEKHIQVVELDWTVPEVKRDFIISESPVYRNAVISRDGSKIAALTGTLSEGDFDNKIIVFDLVNGGSKEFDLYNPTYSQGNVTTDGVRFADVLEFDLTGENIVYDAFNELSGTLGQDLSYWDIGLVNVWDNGADRFTSGSISKFFSGLPENVSVGNPTFSKNSPNIIAFDFIESGGDMEEDGYSVLGYNRETGDVRTIFENNTAGYPSYSLKDDKIIFHVINEGEKILAVRDLNEDKISSTGSAFIFIEGAEWGVYMGNGERNLSTATEEEIVLDQGLNIYPNPTSDKIQIELIGVDGHAAYISLYDIQGKLILNKKVKHRDEIDMTTVLPGMYVLQYTADGASVFRKVVKK